MDKKSHLFSDSAIAAAKKFIEDRFTEITECAKIEDEIRRKDGLKIYKKQVRR